MDPKKPGVAPAPAAILCRYSSHNQDQGQSIEVQLERLEQYASLHNYVIVKKYIEEAVSGMRMDKRDAFREMLSDSREKNCPFKVILVMKWDRYARNLEEAIVTKNDLRRRGFKVISVNDGLGETVNPSTIFAERIIDNFAEYESLQNAVRVIHGMQAAAKRGFNLGIPPYGYRSVKFTTTDKGDKTKLEVLEDEADVVRAIFDMFLVDKIGAAAIRNRLNHDKISMRGRRWSTMQILRILRNPKYIGRCVFGETQNTKKHPFDWAFQKVVVEKAHPAIVKKEDWDHVQKILGETGEPMKRRLVQAMRASDSPFLFSGLMECGRCGAAMLGQTGTGRHGGKFRYYVCGARMRRGKTSCSQPSIRADKAEHKILIEMRRTLSSRENLIRIIETFNSDVTRAQRGAGGAVTKLQKEVLDLDRKRRNLIEAIEDGKVSAGHVDARLEELAALKQKKELDLIETRKLAEKQPVRASQELMEAWERVYGRLFDEKEDLQAQKPLIQSCIISIRVLDLQATVTYSPSIQNVPSVVSLDKNAVQAPRKRGFARRETGAPYVTLRELSRHSGPQILLVDLAESRVPYRRRPFVVVRPAA